MHDCLEMKHTPKNPAVRKLFILLFCYFSFELSAYIDGYILIIKKKPQRLKTQLSSKGNSLWGQGLDFLNC